MLMSATGTPLTDHERVTTHAIILQTAAWRSLAVMRSRSTGLGISPFHRTMPFSSVGALSGDCECGSCYPRDGAELEQFLLLHSRAETHHSAAPWLLIKRYADSQNSQAGQSRQPKLMFHSAGAGRAHFSAGRPRSFWSTAASNTCACSFGTT